MLEGVVNGTNLTRYSFDPARKIDQRQKNFWTALPPRPVNFQVVAQSTPGHHRLSWNEPSNNKIRYYNIYYATSENPQKTQSQRIASVPRGTASYLDWLAAPGVSVRYGLSSVDRYGNESDLVYAGSGDSTPWIAIAVGAMLILNVGILIAVKASRRAKAEAYLTSKMLIVKRGQEYAGIRLADITKIGSEGGGKLAELVVYARTAQGPVARLPVADPAAFF